MRTWHMAWRNIWRNRRRTLVTTAALTLSLLFSTLYSALAAGLLANMERDTLDFELGSVQVAAEGYQDRPSLYTHIPEAAAIIGKLAQAEVPATPRLLGAGLAASGDASAGVQLRGIDVRRDAEVLLLHEQLREGVWLDEEDAAGVVLGRKLAGTLAVTPGAELIVLSQAADGSIANELFRVRGILRSVGEATDRAAVFMTAPAFRRLMSFPEGAHQIIVKRPAELSLEQLADTVKGVAAGHQVQTWKELNPVIATYLASAHGLINFIFIIFYIVVAIVVLNAMLMSVFERVREFGVLKALGVGPTAVLKLIYLESMLQVALAILVALAVSAPCLWYLSAVGINTRSLAGVPVMGMAMMEQWRAVVSPGVFTAPIILLVCVVSIAVLYPSVKAALIQPVEAMRHQ